MTFTTLEPPSYFTLLPRANYVEPEIYAAEVERIFLRQWTFAAHESELSNPGDYIVIEHAGESVVLLRDDSGEINGFFNVCRHRGHRLCRGPSGSVRRLICPYHRWSYSRDGSLLNAPGTEDGELFDYSDWPLHRVHLERWHGLVFMCLAQDGPEPLRPALDTLAAGMIPARPEDLREAARSVIEVRANWKTLLENFLECYHCVGAHPELCASMSVDATYQMNRDWGGEFLGGATPLKSGRLTMSMDGSLMAPPLGEYAHMSELSTGLGGGFGIVPLLTRVICHVDHMVVFTMRPIDTERTSWETHWYVRSDAVEGVDYDRARLTEVWDATNQQDLSLVEGAFRGVKSHRFASGPIHPSREPAIHNALNVYKRLMAA